MELTYKVITKDNLSEAIKAKQDIFSQDNFIAAYTMEVIPHIDSKKYYLVYDEDKLVGITGLYVYTDYPDDAWLGLFGVMSDQRHKGYGEQILRDTIILAKNIGFKYIRLYTDPVENKAACKLYEKLRFIREAYTAEDFKCTIYSLQVKTMPYFTLWTNKMLYLDELNNLIIKDIK